MTTTHPVPSTDTTVPRMLEAFAAMHAAMRRDVEVLPGAIATADGHRARALVRWYDRFRHTLETHHAREDSTVWPMLSERSASFAAHLQALTDDHEALDVALADVTDALRALADQGVEADRATAVEAATTLRTVLVEHLDREEDAAFAELVRCVTEDEYAAIEMRMAKETPLPALAFEAPWMLSAASAEGRAHILANAPAVLGLLNRWLFEPRYDRLRRAAGLG